MQATKADAASAPRADGAAATEAGTSSLTDATTTDGAASDGGATDGGMADGGAADSAPAMASSRLFPESSTWYRDISAVPADGESAAMIAATMAAGGFGGGALEIDFGHEVVTADATAPMTALTPGPAFFRPDCDEGMVPLMAGGALRGEMGYECLGGGECHLLIHHAPSKKLYELWKANVTGGVLTAGCLAVWDLNRVYGPSGRGVDCASADGAGMPIAPLLLTADEVASGEIRHALRFALPNDRIRGGTYLSPATHTSRSFTGPMTGLPLGARLRLRADYPVETLPAQARVVARALQRHGMFLADGGSKALTARSDRSTTAKWGTGDTRLLGERDLAAIQIGDFQVVDGGPRVRYAGDCVRVP